MLFLTLPRAGCGNVLPCRSALGAEEILGKVFDDAEVAVVQGGAGEAQAFAQPLLMR
jgi:hypothetical protein